MGRGRTEAHTRAGLRGRLSVGAVNALPLRALGAVHRDQAPVQPRHAHADLAAAFPELGLAPVTFAP